MLSPLSEYELHSLKNFKYVGLDDSIIYNYVVSPSLNKIIEYNLIPLWLAPNLITLLSLLFNIIGLLFVLIECKNDFSKCLSPTSTLIITITHYLYIIFDNLDGKQARRTKTSSSFGMLLDHGCDVFTNICILYNISHLCRIGNDNIYMTLFVVTLLVGFFYMTYEEYALGELYLGPFNGADEGNFLVATGSLIGFIYGNEFWIQNLPFKFIQITIGQFIMVLVFIGSLLTCSLSCLFKIYCRKGCKSFVVCLYDSLLFYNVFLFPSFYLLINKEGYSYYLSFIIMTISLLYARITIELHIAICTSQTIKFSYDIYIANIILCMNYFYSSNIFLLITLIFSSLLLGIYLVVFIYIRSKEILNYLDINLLTIKPKN